MKNARQAEILNIIQGSDIETQEQLQHRLSEMGIACTQATISRDIKQLQLVKVAGQDGHYKYAVSQHSGTKTALKFKTILKETIVKVDYAQNIVVIHTIPGLASAAASAIDAMNMSAVVGSLAGDDTVMIVMRDMNAAASFCGEIRNLLN